MTKFGFGMLLEIFFQLLPEALIVPNLLAGGANRHETLEDFYFAQGLLEFVVAAAQFPLTRFAAIHFLFQQERGIHPGQEFHAVDRLGDEVHGAGGKGCLEIVQIRFCSYHDDGNVT